MFLDDKIRTIQAAVEQKFLFRKIGLPFDYASNPDDFPSRCFATGKEARAGQPNPSGLGTGYHFSCRNHALLFDGYLLRIECGIESDGDEAILDRLIGGLIRLATVAPKSFLVGGLAPDGRGFYGHPLRENHAAWAFSVARGLTTAAIAPESQEKFHSIAGKWIERIKREKFRLHGMDGKPAPGGDLASPDPGAGPYALAVALTAAKATRQDKDYETYAALADEESRARFGAYCPADDEGVGDFLWRQMCWRVVCENDPDAERVALAKTRLRENAMLVTRHISAWREWDASLAGVPVDLNWRTFPKAALEDDPYGFVPPDSWERLFRERFIEEALSAAYVVMLSGDVEMAQLHAEEMEACLHNVDWGELMTLSALAGAIGVHARGAEMGLWDKNLFESRRQSPSSEVSIGAKYLEPCYDEENPERAGHVDVPPGKRKVEAKGEGGGGGRRKRRRRRK